MLTSIRPMMGFLKASVAALVLAALLVPMVASAGFTDGTVTNDLVRSRPGDSSTVLIGFEKRECVERDANTGDHHDEDMSETAEAWEREADKLVKDDNPDDDKGPSADDHAKAAAMYAYAACLWDMISELDKGEAAYEDAAENYEAAARKYEEAGDKEKAAEMRKKAKEIREKLD